MKKALLGMAAAGAVAVSALSGATVTTSAHCTVNVGTCSNGHCHVTIGTCADGGECVVSVGRCDAGETSLVAL